MSTPQKKVNFSKRYLHTCLGFLLVLFTAVLVLPHLNKSLSGMVSPSIRNIDILTEGGLNPPSLFGLEKVKKALEDHDLVITEIGSIEEARSQLILLAGTPRESETIKSLYENGRLNLSDKKESLCVKIMEQDGRNLIVIAGADEKGLMYALLEIAGRMESLPKDTAVMELIEEKSESPRVPVRSMAVFLHNQDDEKEWYYSREYWEEYFGMLAADRFNSFNLVFSHQTPYLAPMYPFHVDVEKYPEVKVKGLSEEQRRKNLEMLRFISSLAKDRGLDFTLGIWQQIAWGTETHSSSQESMVAGYSRKNMTDYTYLALKILLEECPGITGIQLRLNYESGLTYEEQTDFFRDAVFRASREAGRPITIELRDIGLLSETLDASLAEGLPTRVSHKYWGEHLVFPYHPIRFVWTYSYGDWLRYPRKADQIYQVWSLGSHRLLLWGDPEFVRRFAPTTTFEEALGFEICAPLSQKGYGNAPGAWRIFRDSEREHFRWEFQRYWSFYRLFGRLTYNPSEGNEIWTRELDMRFGKQAAGAVGRAYRAASQVIPLIAGQAISNYNMGVWPEKDMGGLINYYLTLNPYDRARFQGFLEYVDDELEGRKTAKTSPLDVAEMLDSTAEKINTALREARRLIPQDNREFWATEMDFRILSKMARYHAQKKRAAVKLGLYYGSGDVRQLRLAILHGESALTIWKELSSLAERIYASNLVFGPGSVGHWKDGLPFVEDDLRQLMYQEDLFQTGLHADYAFDLGPEPLTGNTSSWSSTYENNFTVEPRFSGVFPSTRYDPAQGYGWISGEDLTADQPDRVSRDVWNGSNKNAVQFPPAALLGDYIRGEKEAVFRMDLPEGHYQATVVMTDRSREPKDHGPMSVTVIERFGERPIVESEVIKAGQTLIKRFNFNMIGERFINFRIKFSADPGHDFIVNAITFTRIEPHIFHVPLRLAVPGQDLNFSASVTLPPFPNDERPLTSLGIITSNASTLPFPSGIERVTLKYAPETAETFQSIAMTDAGDSVFEAMLSGDMVRAKKLFYYFEAEDSTGRIARLPKPTAAQNVFCIDVTSDRSSPKLSHSAVREHPEGEPLAVKITAMDDSAVDRVLLHYRPVRQTMDYSTIRMDRNGSDFTATIPGSLFTKAFDVMYYFEAFDIHGNACFYPHPEFSQPYFVIKVKR